MAFKRYKHLNVPDSWERYFTKYPQGMSILESLFEWVSQVDNMVDNQNKLNDNVAQFRNEIDAFVERFDERLQDEVTQTLQDWQDTGFLDVVISEALQWQLDDYIATNEQDKLSINQQLAQIYLNVKNYGAKGDGITNDTLAIKAALQDGTNIYFPQGVYNVKMEQAQNNSFHEFTDIDGISLIGDNATIRDTTTFNQIIDLMQIFKFTRCKNIKVEGLNYDGISRDMNTTYKGNTFLTFEEKCENISVQTTVKFATYGVRSGGYTNPTLGNCKNFDIKMNAYMVGYPIAIYLADNVNIELTSDSSHRHIYLAGVKGGKITAHVKNLYSAMYHVLLTNAIVVNSNLQHEQRARACEDLEITVFDTGSDVLPQTAQFQNMGAACIGFSLSYVCEGTKFNNLNLNVNVKSDDTYSGVVGALHIISVAKSIRPEVTYNYEPYIEFNNITLSGIIDRTGQTTRTTPQGEIWIEGKDVDDTTNEHLPVFKNIRVEDFIIKKANVAHMNALIINTYQNETDLILKNVDVAGINLSINAGNKTVVLENVQAQALYTPTKINRLLLRNSRLSNHVADEQKIDTLIFENGGDYVSEHITGVKKYKIKTTGVGTYTIPNAIERGKLIKAVSGLMLNYKAPGTYRVGNTESAYAYVASSLPGAGGVLSITPSRYAADSPFPFFPNASQDLIITFVPTDGVTFPNNLDLYIYVYYEQFKTLNS